MDMTTDLSGLRNEYRRGKLDKQHIDPDPVVQFRAWMKEAVTAGVDEPTAMTLATATSDGKPSARIVLLKGFDHDGFTFFTNYKSRKATDLEKNPFAALAFYWQELERQVRVEGKVTRVTDAESDDYFAIRPHESQVGAIISPQSKVVPDRQYLEDLRDDYLKKLKGENRRPHFWGGYRLIPDLFEFWQGRPGRLHDRLQYTLSSDNSWKIERLAP